MQLRNHSRYLVGNDWMITLVNGILWTYNLCEKFTAQECWLLSRLVGLLRVEVLTFGAGRTTVPLAFRFGRLEMSNKRRGGSLRALSSLHYADTCG